MGIINREENLAKNETYQAALGKACSRYDISRKLQIERNIELLKVRLEFCSDPEIHERGRETIENLKRQL